MNFRIENYDPAKHDARTVAELIYEADTEFNAMLYGNRESGVAVIQKLMQIENTYFSSRYIDCALIDGKVVGVLVGYTGRQKTKLNAATGKGFMRIMGFWAFLKKMPTFLRLEKLVTKQIEGDSFYVNSFCVDPAHRGQRIGERMLEKIAEEYPKIYLEVNIHNERGQKFYQRLGFHAQAENSINYKNKKIGAYSMVRGKSHS